MQDWKCIISMLLDENPLIELTDEDATNLVRLLCASVKKAVGERIVPPTDNRKPCYSKAQKVRKFHFYLLLLCFLKHHFNYNVIIVLLSAHKVFFT